MIYLDASVLLGAVLNEARSELARSVLTSGEQLAGSEWLVTEIASALVSKDRFGQLAPVVASER